MTRGLIGHYATGSLLALAAAEALAGPEPAQRRLEILPNAMQILEPVLSLAGPRRRWWNEESPKASAETQASVKSAAAAKRERKLARNRARNHP